MAKLKGLNQSKTSVTQTINLEEILGVSFVGERALRLKIAQAVIDHIKKRTQEGSPVPGSAAFKPYSKDYKESIAFGLLKDSSDVNLTLTGTMLDSMDVKSDGPSSFTIGFVGKTENAKAFNHNTGDTLPKREFFGITTKELKQIIDDNFSTEINRLKTGGSRRDMTIAEINRNRGILNAIDESGELFMVQTLGELFDVD